MASILRSVGRGAVNRHDDVARIQALLNDAVYGVSLKPDGKIGITTIGAIDYFQAHVLKTKATGIIRPDDAAVTVLENRAVAPLCEQESIDLPSGGSTAALAAADFASAAKELGCDVAAIQAVTEVESKGDGFFPSNRPKILFEAHIFSKRTFHVYDSTFPDISSKKWNKGLYKGGEAEYDRLTKAMALDRVAALQSASWGMFQIMGFNAKACGFGTVEDMVAAMFESQSKQLEAFVKFIKSSKLVSSIKSKDWKAFAVGYNGPAYADNKYDIKLANAYAKFSKSASKQAAKL
ncbi:N-acetylmuramidase family protein [Methylobacterium sp. J-076]|uniref:N-acetylmuramidase family protein n=1 Tax=Methylobacterium sp. J-076 TaxID=2836655 RepID=UPI001FBAE7F1|nr:N-acetylmuramidase domain-containing protein [Methylobacterium sp. J-076]MCJ2012728.1 N-acetylmuramidase domain-containing protein [Methylobacterium sp. J-076]